MEKIKTYSLFIFLLIILACIFHAWFSPGVLTGGDLLYNYPSMYTNEYLYPYAWYWNQSIGFGGNVVPLLWIYTSFAVINTMLGSLFHLSWEYLERLSFFYPFLILSLSSIFYLTQNILKNTRFSFFSGLIFVCNTYILMIIQGGQVLTMLAYALAPLVLGIIIKFYEEKNVMARTFLIVALTVAWAIEILLDLRIAYIVVISATLYVAFSFLLNLKKNKIKQSIFSLFHQTLFVFFVPLLTAGMLHMFWVFPAFSSHASVINQFGTAYNSADAVKFFSFAKFEDTIGLLHPNWPENIFGFTHFLRPEFLFLPILAFGSLLFIKPIDKFKEANKTIIFFALLGLLGIFLAKGANDPFGGIYLWMFDHIPGFVMFRDPTKWYVLIAISYAILIPFTIGKIYEWIKDHTEFSPIRQAQGKIFNVQNAFLILVIGYLLFLIRPALLGQLTGTLKTHTVPQEYIVLEKFLSSQNTFSRVMWVPMLERYGFNSAAHPAVNAEDFYHVTSIPAVLDDINKQREEQHLQDLSIKYIIVPYDSEGELFVKDRKYDNAQYLETIAALQKISWLTEIPDFGKIHVFALHNAKDHFWFVHNQKAKVTYQLINPTKYQLKITNAQKGDRIVFTDTYDSHWQLMIDDKKVISTPFENTLNSFVLPQSGTYTATLYYTPQNWVNVGLIISGVTVVALVIALLFLFRKGSGRKNMLK